MYLRRLLRNGPPKANEFGEIRRSRSFKFTDFGTNRKPIYHFLLVNNANLYLAPFPSYRGVLVNFSLSTGLSWGS